MGDIVYRIVQNGELYHEYKSKYMTGGNYTGYNPVSRHERYEKTKEIIGRKARTKNPYGNYASPYYDPVKRKQYYEEHKDHKTRPYGVGASEKKSSGRGRGGSGGSGGKGSKGKSGGRKGSAKGISDNLAKTIAALREQSALDTEAQREKAQEEIDLIRQQLADDIKKLKSDTYDKTHSSKNLAEIRGITQSLQSRIENLQGKSEKEIRQVSKQLGKWITNERKSLERRIAAIYKQNGKEYTPRY